MGGLKTFGRSVASGTAQLVTCPIEGAREHGPFGAFWGLGEGMFNAVLFPCAGAAVGAAQCVRGVANTPHALIESLRGFSGVTPSVLGCLPPTAYRKKQKA